LRDVLPQFVGKIEQIPPMYSAVHHEGKRLYELARAGKHVERKPRSIVIYGLALLGVEHGVARLRVSCSEGTYVRTLVEDLGKAIGLPSHMGALVREGSGPFLLYEARTFEEIADSLRCFGCINCRRGGFVICFNDLFLLIKLFEATFL